MISTAPHYLLFSEARREDENKTRRGPGRWRFVLESVEGEALMDVEDEDSVDRDRLELLAVVRGLEALDHPARVTLISAGHYISHGFRRGLPEWRENGWMWERFGELVPIKNRDLWQRVDRALRFHIVNCRAWRFDDAHAEAANRVPRSSRPRPVDSPWRERIRLGLAALISWLGRGVFDRGGVLIGATRCS